MIRGRDFIVFSDDWGRHPFSCMHIMKKFLPDNRILWVNTIGMRRPRLTLSDLHRSVEKMGSWFGGSTKREDLPGNLTVISPMMFPYNDIAAIRKFNKMSVIKKVKCEMRRLYFQNPILLTTLPNASDYIACFNEVLDIYYCVDDFTEWPGVDKNLIKSMEEKLLTECDLIFASAEELCIKKERDSKKPILLPHGVDFEHFNSGLVGRSKPEVLKDIKKPIVGFFGLISPWIDLDLISNLVVAQSDWSFVFVGRIDADINKLSKLKNVHFVGKVPYDYLPAYASNFDVAIIPFLINSLTISVNPLKLLEYLACGLPVVSTDLPEIRKYSNIVYIADGKDNFLACIKKALSEDSRQLKNERLKIASNHSWETVAGSLSLHIKEYLALN